MAPRAEMHVSTAVSKAEMGETDVQEKLELIVASCKSF